MKYMSLDRSAREQRSQSARAKGLSGLRPPAMPACMLAQGKEPSQAEKQVKGLAIFYGRFQGYSKADCRRTRRT